MAHHYFAYGFHDKAVAKCKAILESDSCPSEVKITLAMSKFHLFQREQLNLQSNKSMPPSPEWHKRKKACYKKAEECIKLLGSCLDKTGTLDTMPSQVLDVAMVDYSRETNQLHELKRCMLCRKKAKLHRSHRFPRFIVEDICKAVTFTTNKRDLIVMPPHQEALLSYQLSHSRAPKELTTYLFCAACEQAFSDQGEAHFPFFLRQVYDEKRPSSVALEQHIEYGEWLYQFCVGLIFRTVCEKLKGGYINDDSLYDLFIQCRKCILDPNYSLRANEDERPLIAMILNPTKAEKEDAAHGFMNYALTSALGSFSFSITALNSLVRDKLIRLHVVIIAFGIFNVMAIVERENTKYISSEYFIHPSGGVYHILEDKHRRKTIPKGLWAYLCDIAEMHERRYVERVVYEKESVDFRAPIPDKASTYRIEEGFRSDIEQFKYSVASSPSPNQKKIINYLPPGYTISLSEQSVIEVPRGHRAIIHFNLPFAPGSDNTFFIALDANFKPYIFFYLHSEGMQLNGGFYVNSDTAVGEEYLKKDHKGEFMFDMPNPIQEFHASIDEVLPIMLKSKGISSLKSLMCFSQMR